MRFALSLQVSFAISIFLPPATPSAQPKPNKRPTVNIPALIDKLVEVVESDIGYSATVSGNSFLPLEHDGQIQVGRLFQQPSVSSQTMREIVKQGAAAVPHLIAHLGDKRKTKIVVSHDVGLCSMFYSDELDYNERTSQPPPAPARGEDEEDGLARLFGSSAKQPHTITVGDLCFVALGQIVNRQFNAVRYQPTAIVIVSSPTHSPTLLTAIKKEWGALTPERHRARLLADFLKPDSEDRRMGACKRLAFYYPDALESLALRFLVQPAYDVGDMWSFLRNNLYTAKDARECRIRS